ncbi:MAG: ferredoxin--NADP reductase, partial [Methyloversatilis sp.]|nr:ferredoxin--NADP reductase [Methyloversatilis sp.]
MAETDAAALALAKPAPRVPRSTAQRISAIRRWTPVLWSIRIERPADYLFQPGHYARLGLPVDTPEAAVWRPYSIVSATTDSELEFLLVLIPGG